ncbi:hypothetical protein, conserved [Plasmodium gonderi]|uniref:Uncharacterized protein n=1 Tax=Plasmodium gonderi TaxID=77519 RepID=A0A1Y1JHA1_PLAGO|nr:hypothetical protein, conserved [Plasmodium gonderi]GAW79813.1 hypothetical protein, conserved [Plasmodium gonderi]
MNLPYVCSSTYTNQNLYTKDAGVKKHKITPFPRMNVNDHLTIFPFAHYNANLLNNESKLKMHKNKVFGIPIDVTDMRMKSKHFNSSIGSTKNNNQNITYQLLNKNDVSEKGKYIFESTVPKSAINSQALNMKMNSSSSVYVEKCNRVIIFDLDDTLIPTYWIRSFLCTKNTLSYKQALREMKKEIHLNKKCNFESVVCSVIHLAVSLAHTVFIVTNARSDKWVETVRWLFPQFSKLLLHCHIPIIRTDQFMEPSPFNVQEYFRFWMSAKKKKFDEILKEHFNFYRNYISNKIDFISLGDTDFEEVATYELQLANTGLINKAFNVKVQGGLSLEDFTGQLKLIQVAMSIISKGSYEYKYLALSGSVQIRMFS